MTGLLVDSDVLIEVGRDRDAVIRDAWTALASSPVLVLYSPVSAAELWRGAREREEPVLRGLLGALTALPIDSAIGNRAGHLLRRYASSHGLQLGDALIAASALEHAVPLWTRNIKHYRATGVEFFSI